MKSLAVMAIAVLAGCQPQSAQPPATQTAAHNPMGPPLISFEVVSPNGNARKFAGRLHLPEGGTDPVPAVVVVHGTAGIDDRGPFHREALLRAGIATFEVDFKTGIFQGAADRPPNKTFLPWLYKALHTLSQDTRIDPKRIAAIGFSLGGQLALNAYSRANTIEHTAALGSPDLRFAAFVAWYPGCRSALRDSSFGVEPSGGPMLIFLGSEDSYTTPEDCREFARRMNGFKEGNVELVVFEGTHHGFDSRAPAAFYPDPASRGGVMYRAYNSSAAHTSRERAVDFLKSEFGKLGN